MIITFKAFLSTITPIVGDYNKVVMYAWDIFTVKQKIDTATDMTVKPKLHCGFNINS